ncbi:MAG: HIT domain-containing protein [Candidatus Doudnabacteria bacterium]|nr:HIT domain-containing protein [Candidatus Doudnabacteria bacterium]
MLKYILIFLFGAALGAYLFSDTQPRTFLEIKDCQNNCFSSQELLGLIASVGIQKYPGSPPNLVKETDKSIVIPHPYPETPIHYLVIPKKDIKNIREVSSEDQAYIMDAFAVIRAIVKEKGLSDYQVITNGPGQQQVTYLHFHLMAQEK